MKFALFEPEHGAKYKEMFERDRHRLFPDAEFPPNPKNKVALQALDDVCDYLPWYYQFGVLGYPLAKYEACVKVLTPVMERHATLYDLEWRTETIDGEAVHYLMPTTTPRIEQIE